MASLLDRRRAAAARPVTTSLVALRLSVLLAALYATLGVYLPFFPVWLAGRSLSDPQIAVILAMPLLMPILANPTIAAFADRRGSIAGTLACCTLAAVLGFVLMGVASGFAALLAASFFLAVARSPIMLLADALTFAEVRRDPGLDYGRIRLWGSAAVLVCMLAGGWVVGLMPREDIIWLLTATAAMAAGAAVWAAQWRPAGDVRGAARAAPTGSAHGDAPLLIVVIAAAALVNGSHALLNSFASLHWRAEGHASSFVGLAWALGVSSEMAVFFFAVRRFGGESRSLVYLALGATGAVLRWLIMALDPRTGALVALQLMHGVTFGATHLGSVLTISRLVPPERRAQSLAWLTVAIAVASGLMTALSGPLYGLFAERAYLVMAVVAASGLALALLAGRVAGAQTGPS